MDFRAGHILRMMILLRIWAYIILSFETSLLEFSEYEKTAWKCREVNRTFMYIYRQINLHYIINTICTSYKQAQKFAIEGVWWHSSVSRLCILRQNRLICEVWSSWLQYQWKLSFWELYLLGTGKCTVKLLGFYNPHLKEDIIYNNRVF